MIAVDIRGFVDLAFFSVSTRSPMLPPRGSSGDAYNLGAARSQVCNSRSAVLYSALYPYRTQGLRAHALCLVDEGENGHFPVVAVLEPERREGRRG